MLTAIPAAAVAFLTCSMLPAIFIILSGGSYGEIALGLFLSIGIASMTLSVRHNFLTSVNLEKLRLLTSTLAAETAAASQAKTRFLANMSHELHTPLNAIIGFGEMIGSEVKGPVGNRTYAEFANSIVESARQLLTMIDDIFDLSRFESGDVKAAETEIAMAGVGGSRGRGCSLAVREKGCDARDRRGTWATGTTDRRGALPSDSNRRAVECRVRHQHRRNDTVRGST